MIHLTRQRKEKEGGWGATKSDGKGSTETGDSRCQTYAASKRDEAKKKHLRGKDDESD